MKGKVKRFQLFEKKKITERMNKTQVSVFVD